MNRQLRAGIAATVYVLTVGVVLVGLFAVAGMVGGDTQTQPPMVTLTVARVAMILGAIEMTALVATLVFLYALDRQDRRAVSRLFVPLIAVQTMTLVVLAVSAARSLDVLLTRNRPRWTIFADPEAVLLQVVNLVLLFLTFGWLLAVVLRGRGWPVGRIGLLYAVLLVGGGVVLSVSMLITGP